MDETLSRPSCFYAPWFRRTFLLSEVETNNVIDMSYVLSCLLEMARANVALSVAFLLERTRVVDYSFP